MDNTMQIDTRHTRTESLREHLEYVQNDVLQRGAHAALVLAANDWKVKIVSPHHDRVVRYHAPEFANPLDAVSADSPLTTETFTIPYQRIGFAVDVICTLGQVDEICAIMGRAGWSARDVLGTKGARATLPEARAWLRVNRPHVDTKRMSISAVKSMCWYYRSKQWAVTRVRAELTAHIGVWHAERTVFVRLGEGSCSELMRPFLVGEAVALSVGPVQWKLMELERTVKETSAFEQFGRYRASPETDEAVRYFSDIMRLTRARR